MYSGRESLMPCNLREHIQIDKSVANKEHVRCKHNKIEKHVASRCLSGTLKSDGLWLSASFRVVYVSFFNDFEVVLENTFKIKSQTFNFE